jgi:replicative superfamily II helicase
MNGKCGIEDGITLFFANTVTSTSKRNRKMNDKTKKEEKKASNSEDSTSNQEVSTPVFSYG